MQRQVLSPGSELKRGGIEFRVGIFVGTKVVPQIGSSDGEGIIVKSDIKDSVRHRFECDLRRGTGAVELELRVATVLWRIIAAPKRISEIFSICALERFDFRTRLVLRIIL